MMSDHSSLSSDSEPPALEVIKTEPQADVDTDEAVKDGFVFVKESSSLKYEDLKMDIEEEILSPGTTKGRYKCSVCFTIHSSKSALATHSCIEATSPMSVGGCICCVCKQTFSRKYNLRQHQISEHTVQVNPIPFESLPPDEKLKVKAKVLELIEKEKYSNAAAGALYGVKKSTASRWWREYKERGYYTRKPTDTIGRPLVSTPEQDAALLKLASDLPFSPTTELMKRCNFSGSLKTAYRRLKKINRPQRKVKE